MTTGRRTKRLLCTLLAGGLLVGVMAAAAGTAAAPPASPDAVELRRNLEKLLVLGSVLYITAHPDDENTAVLAYLSKSRRLRTANFSITRGSGGQNRIGTELDDALAILRTEEMLAARRVDGAEQYFTRALDFGYSKTAEETLSIWGREAVLADMVRVIRTFRPDVIITRFSPEAGGHGHHTASAILAEEAFKAAADPAAFPDQLNRLAPWQAKRLVWNRWRPQGSSPAGWDESRMVKLDPGSYDPQLGKSFSELAAEGRSMHRSQGFGALSRRGGYTEFFQQVAGEPAVTDLLDGVDTTWRRVPGAENVRQALEAALQAWHGENPATSLPALLQAWQAMEKLPEGHWKAHQQPALAEVIRCSAGLWLEACTAVQYAAPGQPVTVIAAAINRTGLPVMLQEIQINGTPVKTPAGPLPANQTVTSEIVYTLPAATGISQPSWMLTPPTRGLHGAPDPAAAILAEDPPVLPVTFRLEIQGVPVTLPVPAVYRFRDPFSGEKYRPFSVIPPVMVNLAESVLTFPASRPREIHGTVIAGQTAAAGTLHFRLPAGFSAEPASWPFSLANPLDEQSFTIRITPPAGAATGDLTVSLGSTDGSPLRGLAKIDYPHIPQQTHFPLSQTRLVRLAVEIKARPAGYIVGAGDEIPGCLADLGFPVTLLDDQALENGALDHYQVIITGIRAWNMRPRLKAVRGKLQSFVEKGGTLIVLHNENNGLVTNEIGPYPFQLSRDRITDELAAPVFLQPSHPVLNFPNRITAADFDGWVQERGIYFANEWDARYETVLGFSDPGEKPLAGGLLVARHGRGWFVYTGLAFFRQLPAGVPGACRLLANLLSLGTNP